MWELSRFLALSVEVYSAPYFKRRHPRKFIPVKYFIIRLPRKSIPAKCSKFGRLRICFYIKPWNGEFLALYLNCQKTRRRSSITWRNSAPKKKKNTKKNESSAKVYSGKIFKICASAKLYSRKISKNRPPTKVYSREMLNFRGSAELRKFLLLKYTLLEEMFWNKKFWWRSLVVLLR